MSSLYQFTPIRVNRNTIMHGREWDGEQPNLLITSQQRSGNRTDLRPLNVGNVGHKG